MQEENESLDSDDFVIELCGNRASWQVTPKTPTTLELENISSRIVDDGYEMILETHLCHTFEGLANLTLFPSGKLMIKSDDKQLAIEIARHHMSAWLAEG